jgi:hypothetical protein
MKRVRVSIFVLMCAAACSGGGSTGPGVNNGGGGGGGGGGGSEDCPTGSICMLASAYNPTTLTVNKNSIVAFINNSGAGHTVTFDDRPDGVTDIPLHTSGTNNRTFTQVGKFKFHCTQHGGMTGEITVN